MNLEEKKKKYLQACRIMDMFNESANLCKIKDYGVCVTCSKRKLNTLKRYVLMHKKASLRLIESDTNLADSLGEFVGNISTLYDKTHHLCCVGCEHITNTGCSVKSLGCKLCYCYFDGTPSGEGLVSEDDPINIRHSNLKRIILNYFRIHDIPVYINRYSMEQTFKYYEDKKEET